jgi:glycosyltransferase involved in cell wall biosynthesis
MRMSWARAVARYFGTHLAHIRFDIIEYPECGAEGLFLRTKNKKVVRLHSPWGIIAPMVEPSSPRADRLLHRLVETISIYKSSAVSSPTRFLLHRLKLHSLVHTVIPNPIVRYGQRVTQEDIKNSSSRNSLVFVGRMDPLKAPHLLITAYHQLHAHAPDDPPPPLIMVGGFYGHLADHTPYGEYITRLASRGEGSRGITFTGAVAHAQIPTYFQSARIAVFTSRWENMPYTCLEAMASGCVVVASDCAGLRELVDHGVTGFLFRKNSTPHLARTLSYVLGLSPRMHQRISHAAYEKVRREFDADVAGKKIEQWYTTLIE